MRTLFINTIPQKWKRLSNSNCLLALASLPVGGEKRRFDYTGGGGRPLSLVFAMPAYVDAVPSHVLELLQFIEAFARENSLGFKVHAICNCGFYEGAHCET